MSRLLVFQHVAAEPLGTLDALIRQRGHRMRFVNFERDPDAQPSTDRYRGLIVLGGPMNVEDRAHRRHLLTEMRAIESMLPRIRPTWERLAALAPRAAPQAMAERSRSA